VFFVEGSGCSNVKKKLAEYKRAECGMRNIIKMIHGKQRGLKYLSNVPASALLLFLFWAPAPAS
jgi:hypothetical protein